MAFPGSYTEFNHLDVSNPFDLEAKLNMIIAMIDDNTNDLSTLKTTSVDIKTCVTKLCTDDVLDAVNDAGWRVLI